jgi:peroxiredoxin
VIHEGNLASDFTLPTPDGSSISLSEFRGRNVLLVFLRHLG